MWEILRTILLSIILIFIIHYIYNFIKNGVLVNQKNDLAKYQSKKYREIVEELKQLEQVLHNIPKTKNEELEKQNLEEVNVEEMIDYNERENSLLGFINEQMENI
jgi:hypothetical protein